MATGNESGAAVDKHLLGESNTAASGAGAMLSSQSSVSCTVARWAQQRQRCVEQPLWCWHCRAQSQIGSHTAAALHSTQNAKALVAHLTRGFGCYKPLSPPPPHTHTPYTCQIACYSHMQQARHAPITHSNTIYLQRPWLHTLPVDSDADEPLALSLPSQPTHTHGTLLSNPLLESSAASSSRLNHRQQHNLLAEALVAYLRGLLHRTVPELGTARGLVLSITPAHVETELRSARLSF